MNTQTPELWNQLRAAYRPETPELDVDAIMTAVRREAAAHPLRRVAPGPVAAIPAWACAVAACLALVSAATVVVRSIDLADRHIGHAWIRTVEPDQFASEFMNIGNPQL